MLMPAQETEWEELIRTGHMTPFGTKVPQKEEKKKEPRRPTLRENSAFDQYLADQAALAVSRKKTPIKKKGGRRPTEGGARQNGAASGRDRKLQKRMRTLQRNALRTQPKAKGKAEPSVAPPRRKLRGWSSDSEGSEYVPSDELTDPEAPERDDEFWDGDGEEYRLKTYSRKAPPKPRKTKTPEEEREELGPTSSDDDDDGSDDVGKKRRPKKSKDDGDVECYKQRIR